MAFFKKRPSNPAPSGSGQASESGSAHTDGVRRRARHRLIGATILVIAIIATLPWLLDVPPPPCRQPVCRLSSADKAPARRPHKQTLRHWLLQHPCQQLPPPMSSKQLLFLFPRIFRPLHHSPPPRKQRPIAPKDRPLRPRPPWLPPQQRAPKPKNSHHPPHNPPPKSSPHQPALMRSSHSAKTRSRLPQQRLRAQTRSKHRPLRTTSLKKDVSWCRSALMLTLANLPMCGKNSARRG